MRRALTYTVREVVPYINWLYFFHAWGMEPRFATVADVHDCPACREAWIASTCPTFTILMSIVRNQCAERVNW